MKINDALLRATKILKSKKVDSPRLDAELLLAFVLKRPREFLFTHPEKTLKNFDVSKFRNLVRCRARHEPIAYITHKKEFYGLEFYVNKNVLIPRPETEVLVMEALKSLPLYPSPIVIGGGKRRGSVIVDVGTGSGCIAMAIAKFMKHKTYNTKHEAMHQEHLVLSSRSANWRSGDLYKIIATDSSRQALKVAKKNARIHNVGEDVTFSHGNLLEPFISQFHRSMKLENLIIVANLPYLTPQEWKKTQSEIRKYEPRDAFVGGSDGLKYYRKLLQQIKQFIPHLNQPRPTSVRVAAGSFPDGHWERKKEGVKSVTCFFEINPQQKKPLKKFISTLFPYTKIKFVKDLNEANRIVKLEINELTD